MEGEGPTFDHSEVPSSIPSSSGEDKKELQNPIKMEEDFGSSFQDNNLSTEDSFASCAAAQPHHHDLSQIHPAFQDFPGNQAPSLGQSSATAMLPGSATPGSYPATQYDETAGALMQDLRVLAPTDADALTVQRRIDLTKLENDIEGAFRDWYKSQQILSQMKEAYKAAAEANKAAEDALKQKMETLLIVVRHLAEEHASLKQINTGLKEELDKRDKEQGEKALSKFGTSAATGAEADDSFW